MLVNVDQHGGGTPCWRIKKYNMVFAKSIISPPPQIFVKYSTCDLCNNIRFFFFFNIPAYQKLSFPLHKVHVCE